MFSQKLFSGRHLLLVLPLVMLLVQFAGVSLATAATCDRMNPNCEFDVQAIVPVSDLAVFCTPPNPITQGIWLTGDFALRAHIVVPPNPILPPNPIIPVGTTITLHLDATRVSGIGLTDGTLYWGGQGTTQSFVDPPSAMKFSSSFELMPLQPTQTPPNPVCPAELSFQVQLYSTEAGIPAISATLYTR